MIPVPEPEDNPVIEILHSDDEGVIFQIQSSSKSKEFHTVGYDYADGWICTCEHYYFRRKYCKHMYACAEYAKEHGIHISDRDVYTGQITLEGGIA